MIRGSSYPRPSEIERRRPLRKSATACVDRLLQPGALRMRQTQARLRNGSRTPDRRAAAPARTRPPHRARPGRSRATKVRYRPGLAAPATRSRVGRSRHRRAGAPSRRRPVHRSDGRNAGCRCRRDLDKRAQGGVCHSPVSGQAVAGMSWRLIRQAGDHSPHLGDVAQHFRREAPCEKRPTFFRARVEDHSSRHHRLQPRDDITSPLPAHDRPLADARDRRVDAFGTARKRRQRDSGGRGRLCDCGSVRRGIAGELQVCPGPRHVCPDL